MLTFCDANVVVGRPRNEALFAPLAMPADLRAYLGSTGLAGALLWHWAQNDGHPEPANALLAPFREGIGNIALCWAILPPGTAEQGDLLARLREARVGAVRLFPQSHRYLMKRVVWGNLLDELGERRVPVLLSLEVGCSYEQAYDLLADYPNLTCVLCDTGTWSMDRYTYPLLERYPNVHLTTDMLSITDGGVEGIVARFGARRLVFGTGFPRRYAEAAMLQLAQAEIPEADRRAIASANLQRLLTESSL
jgi:hypothetical protein